MTARLTVPPGHRPGATHIRQARREDIAQMHAVRLAVQENVLRSPDVDQAAYLPAIE